MLLSAHARVSEPGTLQVWIGVFGLANPPAPVLSIREAPNAAVTVLAALAPIRDFVTDGAGQPLNHRALLRASGLEPGKTYRVDVAAGGQTRTLTTTTLPDALPSKLDGTFNILLCSCYSQPEDASGLLGTIVSQIKMRPDMTMMLGDQIYGDLPIFEDLPDDLAGVAQHIGEKYRRNWTSSQLDTGGLEPVLTRAPVVLVADDHEYWNNYPFSQVQLPKTWTKGGRDQWTLAATGLYEDYQWPGAAGGAQRIDIDSLKILVVDMRSCRDEKFVDLVQADTPAQITKWAEALRDERRAGRPAFGMLCSGQALFSDPTEESRRQSEDAEMSNYEQFDTLLIPALEKLSAAGIPVVYVTGDVHWGRVSQGYDVRTDGLMLYEVIVSPTRLIRVPALDAFKEAKARVGGLFGNAKPWPRHSISQPVPKRLGRGHFRLECNTESKWGYARQGDQVAVMSLCRAGAGIDFNVTYYAVTSDKELARSETTRTYELRNF